MADEQKPITPEGKPTEVVTETPKEDWQTDERLDDNGNVKDTQEVETLTEQEQPEKEPVKEEASEAVDFTAPIVKQIEGLVTQAGLVSKDVAAAVMEHGGKLPPEMAKALVDKHGDLVAGLIADKLETFHKGAQEQAKSKESKVFSKLEEAFKDVTTQSGDKTWGELKAWAKDNVPAEQRAEINKMLAQGGYTAELALDNLITRFKGKGVESQQPDLEGGQVLRQSGIEPISKKEYTARLDALEAKGHVYGESAEMRKLDAQRLAGRQRGL